MRKLFAILVASLLTATVWSQVPQKMSFQAVIRNDLGVLVTNTTVGMRISILQYSASGNEVYVEIQSPKTNANGLVTFEIGNLSNINWQKGPYFLRTETDPTGGTSYTITGTSQLLSVPYALYANKAESALKAIKADSAVYAIEANSALYANKTESFANGAYYTYNWAAGTYNSSIINSNETWKGDRKIIMIGYVSLQFYFPDIALDSGIITGIANVEMYLKYGGQKIMPVHFKDMPIMDNAQIMLPLNAIIPNSTAGNSIQFILEGAENNSQTNTKQSTPQITSGPYPVNVKVTLVWRWVEI